jgi:molybdopterin converting factor small subunit
MPTVVLRAPLSELCGGRTHVVAGSSVTEVLVGLEAAHPEVAGWILDEQDRIREHVNIFVNGERREGTGAVADGDRIHVLPAITGG